MTVRCREKASLTNDNFETKKIHTLGLDAREGHEGHEEEGARFHERHLLGRVVG